MVKRLISKASPKHLKLILGLIVFSFIMLVMYAYVVSNHGSNGNGSNGNLTFNKTQPSMPNGSEQPINVASPPPKDPYAGQWVCGNGIADPGEDCYSCPHDLVEECACLSPEKSKFEKKLGKSFPLCINQKYEFDKIEIELSSYIEPKFTIYCPEGTKMAKLGVGEFVDIWYWEEEVVHYYIMTLDKKIYNGVWITVDYPQRNLGEGLLLSSGAKFWAGDLLITITTYEVEDNSTIIQVEVTSGDTTVTETLKPGEHITVGNSTVEYVEEVDGDFQVIVTGGEEG